MNEIRNIYQDFIKAQKEFEPARKDSKNPHFRSSYASLGACIDAVKDALNNNNFSIIQVCHDCDNGVAIETILTHISGEIIRSGVLKLPASKLDAQGYGSAMTYARRYSLLAVCGIAPEDDDGNHSVKSNEKQFNKPILQQKLEKAKESQAKSLSKEELILGAEKAASMGIKELEAWWKGNLSDKDREILKNNLESLKLKAKEVDELNQDINQ